MLVLFAFCCTYCGHSSARMILSSIRGIYDVGIGCQFKIGFHRCTFLGGNKLARTSCRDIFVLSKSELLATTSFGAYKLPRKSLYLERKNFPNLYSCFLPSCERSHRYNYLFVKNNIQSILKLKKLIENKRRLIRMHSMK